MLSDNRDKDEINWQQFEDEAEEIIQKSAKAIQQLRDRPVVNNFKLNRNYRDHLNNLFFILESYLKDVCRTYSKQKAIRVNRYLEKKNMSQLYSDEIVIGENFQNKKEINIIKLEEMENEPSKQLIEDKLTDQELLEVFHGNLTSVLCNSKIYIFL
jgi:hypothetical protein